MSRNHALNPDPRARGFLFSASGAAAPVSLDVLGRMSQMSPSARIVGWLWFVAPLVLLAYLVWVWISEFVGFAYYVAASGALLLLALCGAWFLIGMSGARWALRVAAVIVALFVVLNSSIPWSNAPFYGGHDVAFYAYLVLVVALCAVTFFIGGQRAA